MTPLSLWTNRGSRRCAGSARERAAAMRDMEHSPGGIAGYRVGLVAALRNKMVRRGEIRLWTRAVSPGATPFPSSRLYVGIRSYCGAYAFDGCLPGSGASFRGSLPHSARSRGHLETSRRPHSRGLMPSILMFDGALSASGCTPSASCRVGLSAPALVESGRFGRCSFRGFFGVHRGR